MASVLHRITKEYYQSVNTPDYPLADWIINPDLSQVSDFPSKYWIITGDVISLMSQSERDAVDASETETQKDQLATNLDRELKALVLALNDGSFVPGSNYDNLTIKSIIKDRL